MTTIAYKDGVLASDTQITGEYVSRGRKVQRLDDGSLVGYCGSVRAGLAVIEWLASGAREEDEPDWKDAVVLMVKPNKKVFILEGSFPGIPHSGKFAAIGSGSCIAMGAMAAGASAKEALHIACKYDGGTSGPVNTLRLGY